VTYPSRDVRPQKFKSKSSKIFKIEAGRIFCSLEQAGEPNYYRGPHELCIIAGEPQIPVILSQNSTFINYEEERLLLSYYLNTYLSYCFVLTWWYRLTWVTNILERALSNVRADRRFPASALYRVWTLSSSIGWHVTTSGVASPKIWEVPKIYLWGAKCLILGE